MLAPVLAVVVKVEAVSSPADLCEKLKEISLQTNGKFSPLFSLIPAESGKLF